MSIDLKATFWPLADLIVPCYILLDEFIVFSDVETDRWNVHVARTGDDPKWWKGSWTVAHVVDLKKKAEPKLLETFAKSLAGHFEGDLNIKTEQPCRLILGPASTTPSRVDLEEMSAAESEQFALKVFARIAHKASKARASTSTLPSSTAASSSTSKDKASTKASSASVPVQVDKPASTATKKRKRPEQPHKDSPATNKAKGAPLPLAKPKRPQKGLEYDSDD